MVKRKQLASEEVTKAFKLVDAITVRLVKSDIKRALDIALQFNIYAYDVYFLQAVLSLDCPLITLDIKMQDVDGIDTKVTANDILNTVAESRKS